MSPSGFFMKGMASDLAVSILTVAVTLGGDRATAAPAKPGRVSSAVVETKAAMMDVSGG